MSARQPPATVLGAEPADLNGIYQLERDIFGEHGYPRLVLRQFFDLFESGFAVVRDGNSLAAYGLFMPTPQSSSIWVLSLCVASEQRGRGLGRAVMEYGLAQDFARSQDVLLTVHPANTVARQLYRSVGFEETAEEADYFGDGETRLVMRRAVADRQPELPPD